MVCYRVGKQNRSAKDQDFWRRPVIRASSIPLLADPGSCRSLVSKAHSGAARAFQCVQGIHTRIELQDSITNFHPYSFAFESANTGESDQKKREASRTVGRPV